jgi:predicted RNA binding protein YcfA (HicA-like mRNA interferase family)
MSSSHPPLTCKKVKRGLKKLGFMPTPIKGTSHEHWKKIKNGILYKVTAILIMSLAQLHKEASDIFILHQILLQIDNCLILQDIFSIDSRIHF